MQKVLWNTPFSFINFPSYGLVSCGHATLHLAALVRPSVHKSVAFLNCKRFLHDCSCPTIRNWIAVYPALFLIADTQLYKSLCPSVRPFVRWWAWVKKCETRNSAPAHPSTTGMAVYPAWLLKNKCISFPLKHHNRILSIISNFTEART